MDLNRKKLLSYFTPQRILIPVVIGLGVIGYMFYRDSAEMDLTPLYNAKPFWLVMTFLVLVVRDFGYIYRIRYVTEKFLSWRKSLDVIMLWEFASCVMPSVVGGSTVAAFILNKEGISLGKSLAYVMVTAMLDNLYFIIAVPLVFLITRGDIFPEVSAMEFSVTQSLEIAFVVSYALISLYAFIMAYGLLINPTAVKRLFLRATSFKLTRRFRAGAYKNGNELVWASQQLKGSTFGYWANAALSTAFVWTARYFVINCLIAAFTDISFHDHVLIFSRNMIYKIVLLVAVTPGGAGIAEVAFPTFFGQFLGRFTTVIVLMYRVVTYYLYLILGSFFLPRWVLRVFGAHPEDEEENDLRLEPVSEKTGLKQE
ncbi:lysylphosphatidylglycerol synthase transmembrane domain-containing protein [Rufibacter soli]